MKEGFFLSSIFRSTQTEAEAMSERNRQLDSTIDIVTPENIAFQYQVAGPFRRLPAFVIDFVIRAAVLLAIVMAVSIISVTGLFDSQLAVAAFMLTWFVMEWFYGGLLETFWNGQTVGKRMMGIRVLSTDGQPITGMQAVMRNILRFVDMMPMLPIVAFTGVPSALGVPTFVIGLITPLMNDRYQRLGDLVCGTMVVIEEKGKLIGAATLDDPRVAQLASYVPASYSVSRSMARALATYVDRRQFFSPSRRHEIAKHLARPLLATFGLPADTSYDLLLCALYYRTFITERAEDVALPSAFLSAATWRAPAIGGNSPFSEAAVAATDVQTPAKDH